MNLTWIFAVLYHLDAGRIDGRVRASALYDLLFIVLAALTSSQTT